MQMSKRIIIPVILIIILTIFFGTFSAMAQHPGGDGGDEEITESITYNNYSSVGGNWETTIAEELDGITITNMEFELSWTDDEGSDSDPDTFSLQTDDERHEPKSSSGSGGMVAISWDEDGLNNVWNVMVTCDSAGPTTVPRGPLGFITDEEPDPGNSWTLVVTYTYTESTGSMGGMPANVRAVYSSPIFWIHVGLMISSTYLFLFAGVFAGVFIYSRNKWNNSVSKFKNYVAKPNLLIILVILAFIAFFLASVPIGMWVAGMMYGWTNAWTGFPAIWNPDAFSFTNADNVSFIVLLLWAIPVYLNRRQIMQHKWFKKFFGWSKFLMSRAEKAPSPRLLNKELAICYFFMGFMVFLVFMVQPHGSG